MRVIIPTGPSTRLWPLTKNLPKCLLKVGGETILNHQLRILRQHGLTDIHLITSYQYQKLEKIKSVKTHYNPFYSVSSNLYTLWLYRNLMKDGFILLYYDVVFHPKILTKLLAAAKKTQICLVIGVEPCDEESMKTRIKDGHLVEINKTMPPQKATGEWIGLTYFSKKGAQKTIAALEEKVKEGDLKAYFAEVFQFLADQGEKISVVFTDGLYWVEVDDLNDLKRARKLF